MRRNKIHACEDLAVVRRLIRENPWATLVSVNNGEIVASHYPLLLDHDDEGITVLTHVGRPDEVVHGFGDREILVIVEGANGYVSPSWYAPGAIRAPTWNFSVAHCYGVPELLGPDETLDVMARLVERFERQVDEPMLLDRNWGAPIALGTVGIRLKVTRFVCKIKLSQDKDPLTQRQVIDELRREGPYQNLQLANDMDAELFHAVPPAT